MQRPKTFPMRRPVQVSGLSARTPKEAAIHLVRLEFDRSRIDRGIAQSEQRLAVYHDERRAVERRRRALLELLNR